MRALRRLASRARGEARFAASLRALPRRVGLFYLRARMLAWRRGDQFSLVSATRPANLRTLLELARGRRRVVELGTGTAWTTLALAIDDRDREVVSFDPQQRPEREPYLRLVSARVRARITFVAAAGSVGPQDANPIDLLYVDSSHERQATIDELRAWQPALRPGALVIFDDYDHPQYPGVRAAIAELGLAGEPRGSAFVHEVS